MKIQIKSDLHQEINKYSTRHRISQDLWENAWSIHPQADVLVLAGDIVPVSIESEFDDVAERLLSLDIPVIYVPGNHEYWGGSIPIVNQKLNEMFQGTNVRTVNTEDLGFSVEIEDVTFLGCTLWSFIRDKDMKFLEHWPDFSCIEGLDPYTYHQLNDKSIDELFDLTRPIKQRSKIVIVTHHLPGEHSLDPKFEHTNTNSMFYTPSVLTNALFANNKLKAWIHGHTHCSNDYERGRYGARVISNPFGHFHDGPMGNPDYKPDLIIEV